MMRLIIAAGMLAFLSSCNSARAQEAQDPIVGVWECPASRPDSTTFVVYEIFYADGNVHVSSGSDLYAPGYSSRGGFNGVWSVTADGYHAKFVEILYHNKNETIDVSGGGSVTVTGLRDESLGRFYVDQTISMRQDAQGKDTWCSGNAASGETDTCPATAVTKLLRINFDGTVTLPAGTLARTRCSRMADVFPAIP